MSRLPPFDRAMLRKTLETEAFFRASLKRRLSNTERSQGDVNYVESVDIKSAAPSYLAIGARLSGL